MSPASGKLLHQWEKPTVTVLATASVNKNAKTAPNNKSLSHICSLRVMHTDHDHNISSSEIAYRYTSGKCRLKLCKCIMGIKQHELIF